MNVKRRKHNSTSDAPEIKTPATASSRTAVEEQTWPTQISVGVYRRGESDPYDIIVKEVPKGFPAEWIGALSDFYCEGFAAGTILSVHPRLRLRMAKGRPSDPALKDLGREAARLHETKGMSYGEIALRLCEKKNEPDHLCGGKCANRIRQRAKPFLKPES